MEPCSAEEISQVITSQEILPPPLYIEFLELCGRGRGRWGRELSLFYPDNLNVRKQVEELGVMTPDAFVFALHSVDNQEDAYFSTCSHTLYCFMPKDDRVYLCHSEDGWRPQVAASDFTTWLEAMGMDL